MHIGSIKYLSNIYMYMDICHKILFKKNICICMDMPHKMPFKIYIHGIHGYIYIYIS